MSRTTIRMSGPADEVLAEVLFRVASHLVEAEVNCKAVACQLEAKGVELEYKDGDAVDALRSLATQIHEVCAEFLDEEPARARTSPDRIWSSRMLRWLESS